MMVLAVFCKLFRSRRSTIWADAGELASPKNSAQTSGKSREVIVGLLSVLWDGNVDVGTKGKSRPNEREWRGRVS